MGGAARRSLLGHLRAHRAAGIALFVLLVLIVSGERRLAEIHFNLRLAAGPALENNDALDGDEIRVRLVVAQDDRPPTLPRVRAAITPHAAVAPTANPVARPLGQPAPRGPPALASSTG